jgi:molybdopterin converting factor small subunit
VAVGTLRFWAAARAAAGVAEEPYDAETLADALAATRSAHGPELGKVLDRCSFVVDEAPVGGRAHADVRLTDGGSVEVLPPFAGGAGPAPAGGPRAADAADKLVAGAGAGLLAAALAGTALLGTAPLGVAVFAVQVVVALAWLAVLDVRGRGGAFVIVVVAAAVMDVVVGVADDPDIGRAAGVLGVTFSVALLFQLVRRPRRGVTLSMVGILSAATFALSAASYLALRTEVDGDRALVAALLGAGVALLTARLTDVVLPRPVVPPDSRRGIAGLAVGLGVAVLVGWAYGRGVDVLGGGNGLRLAVVTAVLALAADVAVDAVLNAAPPGDDRARSALPPLGVLLPVVVCAPAAYVAGRILLG